jgi:iron complex outermembrane receptor protein
VDIVATYDWILGDLGDVLLTTTYSYNETEVDDINAPPGVDEGVLFPTAQVDLVETGQPRHRVALEADWQRDRWSSTLRFSYFGEVETSFWTCNGLGIPTGGPPGNICADALGLDDSSTIKSDGALLTDLEIRYLFDMGLRLTVGGNNIFDEQPDKIANNAVHRWISDATSGFGNFRFPWESTPYGTDGAFFYLKVDFDLQH